MCIWLVSMVNWLKWYSLLWVLCLSMLLLVKKGCGEMMLLIDWLCSWWVGWLSFSRLWVVWFIILICCWWLMMIIFLKIDFIIVFCWWISRLIFCGLSEKICFLILWVKYQEKINRVMSSRMVVIKILIILVRVMLLR